MALRCSDLGLPPPPAAARLRVTQAEGVWRVHLECDERDIGPLTDWLIQSAPTEVMIDASRKIVAYSREPPRPFAMLGARCVRAAHVTPAGDVLVEASGERDEVRELAARLQSNGKVVNVQRFVTTPAARGVLTDPQDEAIRVAAEAGYYKIPRALNLIELAQRLGVSPASMSERLRRAEARLVSQYVSDIRAGTGAEDPPPRI